MRANGGLGDGQIVRDFFVGGAAYQMTQNRYFTAGEGRCSSHPYVPKVRVPPRDRLNSGIYIEYATNFMVKIFCRPLDAASPARQFRWAYR